MVGDLVSTMDLDGSVLVMSSDLTQLITQLSGYSLQYFKDKYDCLHRHWMMWLDMGRGCNFFNCF